ncbi:unnamed protein product [Effrenium voratum]|uniref:PUM-HD domain-containing protein n=1 Tax=Effrenium voratum TaxID=2562239 RepID=A0AA36N8Y2_9DINO|nr:unnamed protein product [Effrenium voratum]CAJ1454720.1 unnamed protein product [Effrenium voratum]
MATPACVPTMQPNSQIPQAMASQQCIVAMLVPAMQVPAPMGTMPGFPMGAQAVAMFCTQPMAMGTQPMAMCTQPMAMATQPEGLQPKKEWSSFSSSDSTSDEISRAPTSLSSKSSSWNGPVAAGRVWNSATAFFNEYSCDELQVQLEGDAQEVALAMQTMEHHVWDLSCHPQGCRLVQLALERNQRQAGVLSSELEGHVLEAMVSPHANYVIQKVLTQLTWSACSFVATGALGHGTQMSRHRFGCRIFCRLFEFHARQEGTLLLVEEILQEAEDLSCHPFGHHVIQTILEHGCQKHRDAVAEVILSNPMGFAQNQNSSYLVEKALLNCSDVLQEWLLSELSSNLTTLAPSRYGCYVARAVVEHPKTQREVAMAQVIACVPELRKTKHGQFLMYDLGLDRRNRRK